MHSTRKIANLFAALGFAVLPATGRAAGVVGNGTPASCTAAALTQALAGGGTVGFACGGSPQTIVLPQRQTIAADTTIQGAGLVTLSGGNAHGLFAVSEGRSLTLTGLTLVDGGVENWAIYVSADATLVADGVTVQHCTRGGVYNAGGDVTVRAAIFAGNDAGAAGAAITNENGGTLTVERSTFHANLNGALYSAGPATVTDSTFSANAGDSAGGGAIVHSANLTVRRCRFDGNQAVGGGAIQTSGDLVVEDSAFHANAATIFDGGAIALFNQTQTPSSVTVRRSTFTENVAKRSGGAVRCDAPNGACTLENVTFSRNAVGTDGGATEVSLKSGTTTLTHVTVLAGGSPALERVAGTLTLRNSVVDDGGCAGQVVDGGGNVQGAAGLCAAGVATGDPALFALADNGGFTGTHELGTSSAALGAAATACLATDQRGVARPATGCDAGAFQRGAIPQLASLEPSHATVGGPAFTLVVHGSSFVAGPSSTRALWNGQPLSTTVVSPTELAVAVPAELIASIGTATVTVENPNPPIPDGGVSPNGLPFSIDAAAPPPPPAGPCDDLAGYAAVLCALEQARMPGALCAAADLDAKLAKPLQTALAKASTFVAAARDASAKKRPKFLRKGRAQLDKLVRRANGKRIGATTPACRTSIVDRCGALAGDVAGLGQ